MALVLDPEQLFDASIQLTFLAGAFLGAFATNLIQATSGPLARGFRDLSEGGPDVRLEPCAPRSSAQGCDFWRKPYASPRACPTLRGFGSYRSCAPVFFFYDITVNSAIAQFGLALPMVVYFHRVGSSGLSANALVVPIMGFALAVGFAAVMTGRSLLRQPPPGCCVYLRACHLTRRYRAELARSHAAALAGGGSERRDHLCSPHGAPAA